VIKSGDFYVGSRTRDSANRCLAVNHSALVACVRSDTRHCDRVVEIRASVRGTLGSTPGDRHHGRKSFCRACSLSPFGILLARNRKCQSMVRYPGYSFTPGLNFDTSMPHAHPVYKDPGL